jgi:hypothetical protein
MILLPSLVGLDWMGLVGLCWVVDLNTTFTTFATFTTGPTKLTKQLKPSVQPNKFI